MEPDERAEEGFWRGRHIGRSFGPPDPFAPECGCEVAACGFVVARDDCDQHGPTARRTIRHVHAAELCPAVSGLQPAEVSHQAGPGGAVSDG